MKSIFYVILLKNETNFAAKILVNNKKINLTADN